MIVLRNREVMYSKPDAAVAKKLIDKAPRVFIDSYKGKNISVFDQGKLPLGYRIKSIFQSKARNYDRKLRTGKLPQLTESSFKRHSVRF
jgi:hypothetical protein